MRRTFVHFGGPQNQNLGAKTQNFYSRGFCPFLGAPNSKFGAKPQFLLRGLLPQTVPASAGRRFYDDDEVKKAVAMCFASQAAAFYDEGIQKLVQRYDKCLNNGGNYVKK
jgi:hypothetical protein